MAYPCMVDVPMKKNDNFQSYSDVYWMENPRKTGGQLLVNIQKPMENHHVSEVNQPNGPSSMAIELVLSIQRTFNHGPFSWLIYHSPFSLTMVLSV